MATHELTTNVAAGPVTGTSYVFGAVDGGSDTGPDAIPLTLIYDYIKSATDQIYPTQAQLSSLSDTVATALLQANATWQGQNLPTTGFAAAIDDTGLVTRAQAQQIFNSAALDVLTTRGDLVSHDGIDLVRIALGGSGHLLQSDGSDPVWVSVATAIGIGTAVQAYDATLQSLSGLGTVADRIAYTTALDTWAETALTSFARTLIDDADATTAQATLGLVIGTDVQAYDAELAAIAGLTSAADRLPYFTGSGTASLATFTTYGRTLAALADASAGRTALGVVIGTDVQAFDADLAALAANATDGLWAHTGAGTGAARTLTAPAAGFTITNPAGIAGNPTFVLADDLAALEALSGTDTIYYRSAASTWTAVTVGGLLSFSAGTLNVGDAELTAIAGLTSAADSAPYFTGSGSAALMTVTAAARTVLDDTTVGAMLTTLGGQPLDAELSAIAGLTSAADRLPYFTGSGTAALATFTSFGRSIVDDADASAARTTLGLVIGTDVQAQDAELAALAGLTSAADALPYFTGSGTATTTTLTSFGRTLIDDTDASTARGTLGLGSLATQSGTFSGTSSGTNTGDQTIALTGDVTGSGTGSFAATIAANAVTNAKAAQMAANTIKGNNTGGTANAADLTASQATAMLDVFVGDSGSGGTKGLVNAPATGDSTKFLKGDGTWASIPGGGDALTSNPLSQFAATTSAQLRDILSDETGTGLAYFQGGDIGTPSAGTLTNCTGLPVASGISGLGTDVATFLATPSSANLAAAVTGGTGSGALVFGTGPTIDAPVITGLTDISGATAGQIKFPATQNASTDANTLDDYEEGTFTPGVTFGGGSTGITYTTQTGVYTKIGRLVFGVVNVTLSNKGSSTGAMVITGLPFAAGLANWTNAVGYAAAFSGLTGALTTLTNSGVTTFTVYQSAAATYSVVTDTAATNTTALRINFFYMV